MCNIFFCRRDGTKYVKGINIFFLSSNYLCKEIFIKYDISGTVNFVHKISYVSDTPNKFLCLIES